jgi:hypothetical protein
MLIMRLGNLGLGILGSCKSFSQSVEMQHIGSSLTERSCRLAKMQSDRRIDGGMKYSPIFGRYSFLHEGSDGQTISVGDEVVVSKRNSEHTRFGKCSHTRQRSALRSANAFDVLARLGRPGDILRCFV